MSFTPAPEPCATCAHSIFRHNSTLSACTAPDCPCAGYCSSLHPAKPVRKTPAKTGHLAKVRDAARAQIPLNGTDAYDLHHAFVQAERAARLYLLDQYEEANLEAEHKTHRIKVLEEQVAKLTTACEKAASVLAAIHSHEILYEPPFGRFSDWLIFNEARSALRGKT